jgi:hypothetical protein
LMRIVTATPIQKLGVSTFIGQVVSVAHKPLL